MLEYGNRGTLGSFHRVIVDDDACTDRTGSARPRANRSRAWTTAALPVIDEHAAPEMRPLMSRRTAA
ncbi:MAG: hypothetical protein ACLTSX_14240 [Collinsella sp.]